MPLTVSISVSQNNGQPSVINLTDTSTGSDPGITSRRVYIYKADNTTLVPSGTTTAYTVWPIADSTIALDVLSRDFAVTIVVEWLTGSTVTYTYTNTYDFTAYTRTFLFNLSVDQLGAPIIINSTNWFSNKAIMWVCVNDADNAIAYGGNVTDAQLSLDIAYNMIVNSSKYF